ncbi:hypothetical protein [Acinetobacter bereziniae]|uniref:hypothetical protein n=1 Tax=Acinetobacter bereziniae TaxID=106648 RepID=UPI001D19348E|nr:hypothetical protein [Acinetobacter bereziniae]
MPKLRNLNVFMNGTAIGTATNISFDLASQPDYSVECLYLKHGGRISFIKTRQMGKTEINADYFKGLIDQFSKEYQKQNRQLLPGTYISICSS